MKTAYTLLRRLPCLLCFTALLTLSTACDGYGEIPATPDTAAPGPLAVTVSVAPYTGGGANTRINDDGLTTYFASNDRFGLIILDADGNVLCNNAPYMCGYSYTSCFFDTNNDEGKTAPYYDSRAATYIAYFPYSKEADGCTSTEQLKEKFQPFTDQRSVDSYRASDLLLWSHTGSPLKSLQIKFIHAYALFRFTPRAIVTTDAGDVPLSVNSDEVNFTVGDEIYYPLHEGKNQPNYGGIYRLILPVATDISSLHWFFPWAGTMGSGEISGMSLSAGSVYPYTASYAAGSYKIADNNVTVGDFYCKSDDGTAYLLPDYAPMFTAEEKARVIGIVYKTGNPTDVNSDTSGDAGLQTDHSGCTHGWVAAINNINSEGCPSEYGYQKWSDPSQDIDNWAQTNYSGYTKGSIREESKRNGYSNTKVLTAYNDGLQGDDVKYLVSSAAAVHLFRTAVPGPASSSDWYLPSKQELHDLYGSSRFQSQLDKVGGKRFGIGSVWSSTEFSESSAWNVWFSDGDATSYPKSYSSALVRPVLAF